jgi:hypothetical protein
MCRHRGAIPHHGTSFICFGFGTLLMYVFPLPSLELLISVSGLEACGKSRLLFTIQENCLLTEWCLFQLYDTLVFLLVS